MTQPSMIRAQLQGRYPQTHAALAKLVLALEYSAQNMGKRTWYGADKSKKAYHKLGAGLRDTMQALHSEQLVTSTAPPIEVLQKLLFMLQIFQQAYPNWPAAYSFADYFFNEESELALAVVNYVRNK